MHFSGTVCPWTLTTRPLPTLSGSTASPACLLRNSASDAEQRCLRGRASRTDLAASRECARAVLTSSDGGVSAAQACARALFVQENADARTAVRMKREQKSRGHQSQHHAGTHACMPSMPEGNSCTPCIHAPLTTHNTLPHRKPRAAGRQHSLSKCRCTVAVRCACPCTSAVRYVHV